jgi:hypothetical protein
MGRDSSMLDSVELKGLVCGVERGPLVLADYVFQVCLAILKGTTGKPRI